MHLFYIHIVHVQSVSGESVSLLHVDSTEVRTLCTQTHQIILYQVFGNQITYFHSIIQSFLDFVNSLGQAKLQSFLDFVHSLEQAKLANKIET